MLRHAAAKAARHVASRATSLSSGIIVRRNLTNKKRALNKNQLAGAKNVRSGASGGGASNKVPSGGGASNKAPADSTGAAPAASSSSSEGGGIGAIIFLVLGAAGAGAAYYFGALGGDKESVTPGQKEEKKEDEKAEGSAATATATTTTSEEKPASDVKETAEAVEALAVELAAVEKSEGANRVLQITVPQLQDGEQRPPPVEAALDHPEDGSRVDVAALAPSPPGSAGNGVPAPFLAELAAEELRASARADTEAEMRAAHLAMRAELDDAYLKDLETLSPPELKVRIVQLAAEMNEKTKWEAVRTKEFLALKEKEVADKYQEVFQKQRLEFEELLGRRLREQEDTLTRKANEVVQAKENAVQSLLQAASDVQEAEHQAAMNSAMDLLKQETLAKYESEFGTKLADEKASFQRELEEKVDLVSELQDRLARLEQALTVSRTFESGSQKAHRISAAALALAEKMESSSGAGSGITLLKQAAGEDEVIASALSKLPDTIVSGIPTVAELQTKFEKVHSISRQAALVPEGQNGLGGQLVGMLYASVTSPPSPEAEHPGVPESSSDLVLSRAYAHVQMGDIERAIEELERLKGQPAFVVKDWKQAAMDRIAVNKALKVIKMECALLNESMSGAKS